MSEQRIGTAERESALAALGEHFALGRLSKEEYDERSDAAWSARTASDLRPLFADLPHGSPVVEATGGPSWRGPLAAGPVPTAAADHRTRARQVWRGLPPPVQVVLGVVLALLVLAHLPLVILAGVLWFVLSRHHGLGRPPWAQARSGCGSARG